MALENNWVTYLNRGYSSIKNSILTRMQTVAPEITDLSSSNVLVIIIDAFAGLVEQLNYYIDNLARESHIITARRYSSMIKLVKLIDYRVKSSIASRVDLKITALDASDDPIPISVAITIPLGTIVSDGSKQFITQSSVTIPINGTSATVPAKQSVLVSSDNIGTTSSAADQVFLLPSTYEHGTLQIIINSLTWELQDTLAFSGPNDQHFIVEVNEDKESWVLFGDGVNGAIPPTSQSVLATYYTTSGLSGNVAADTITTWISTEPAVGSTGATSFSVTNPLNSVGGLGVEGLEGIRSKAPLSLRTLDRAVTLQDHKDICLLVPGIGKATAYYNPQYKSVTLYVAPTSGGTAGSGLLQDVEDFFETRKILSTTLSASAAGETKLRISMEVTVKFRRNVASATTDIQSALVDNFGFNSSSVNRKIRRSDIIALIDNLDKVDFLTLGLLTTKPFPRVLIGTNSLEANWRISVNSSSSAIISWRISVTSTITAAKLFRTENSVESLDSIITIVGTDPGVTNHNSTSGEISLAIWGTFANLDTWEFTTYPYNEDIVFEDFTVPVFDTDEFSLTINEQVL